MSCLNHLILLYISEVIIELVCREKSESIVFRSTKIRVYRHKKIDNFFGECQSGSISGFNITGFQLRIHRPHFRMTTMRPFSKKKNLITPDYVPLGTIPFLSEHFLYTANFIQLTDSFHLSIEIRHPIFCINE